MPLKAIVMAQKSDVELAPGICVDAIEALGLCGEHAPIDFLTELLQYAALEAVTNDRIQSQAAETLGEAGHYVPLELFYTMLGNKENYKVREPAIQGMILSLENSMEDE